MLERQTYPDYEPLFNVRFHDKDAKLLTKQDYHIGRCTRMAWRSGACVRASGRGPVDYARHRMDDHVLGPCKHITGERDDRAIYGEPICLSHPWVQVLRRRPRAQTRTQSSRVPLETCGSAGLNHASELPDTLFGNLAMYLHDTPVNETLPAKTLSEQRLDRMYWVHWSEGRLDIPVVILGRVREDLLAVVRNGLAEEYVHLTHCMLGRKRVGVME
jgi:hypothetical protein